MLRVFLRTTDIGDAAHVDLAPVVESLSIIDIDAPDVEARLHDRTNWKRTVVIGVEVLEAESSVERPRGRAAEPVAV